MRSFIGLIKLRRRGIGMDRPTSNLGLPMKTMQRWYHAFSKRVFVVVSIGFSFCTGHALVCALVRVRQACINDRINGQLHLDTLKSTFERNLLLYSCWCWLVTARNFVEPKTSTNQLCIRSLCMKKPLIGDSKLTNFIKMFHVFDQIFILFVFGHV